MTDENATYQKAQSGQPLALEPRDQVEDGRRFSPSIGRNKDIVREAFLRHMPTQGRVLEIASGTGEHGVHMTAAIPKLEWTYSDIDPASQASQTAWRAHVGHDRLKGPLTVDTTDPDWSDAERASPWEGLFCANMIHIAPFQAAEGLLAGAGRLLAPRGRLMLYGPFARSGEIAPSNAQFSADLKRRDPSWGVRDLDLEILPLARQAGLQLETVETMPANNLSVVFARD
ncbi:MAG: DUF938 domain-containing protein [Pseudomonadota bacterium]